MQPDYEPDQQGQEVRASELSYLRRACGGHASSFARVFARVPTYGSKTILITFSRFSLAMTKAFSASERVLWCVTSHSGWIFPCIVRWTHASYWPLPPFPPIPCTVSVLSMSGIGLRDPMVVWMPTFARRPSFLTKSSMLSRESLAPDASITASAPE